jgi:hemerythrin
MITTWKDEYNTGIAAIDSQHKGLLDQINCLSEAISTTLDDREITDAVHFIEEYVKVHFKTEESLMMENHYPFMAEHVRQHIVFYEYFKKLKKEMEEETKNRMFLSFRTQVFLVDWLINHSTKTDKHLGKYLQFASKTKTPPEPGTIMD